MVVSPLTKVSQTSTTQEFIESHLEAEKRKSVISRQYIQIITISKKKRTSKKGKACNQEHEKTKELKASKIIY
tara:strand:- start:265 stop:483 length:219 start_codon:yes stop_codon:yes gene_type:complete